MAETFPDPERFRIADQQIVKHSTSIPKGKKGFFKAPKVQGEFLKGPIPLNWLKCATELSGKAPLATALAIMFEVGRRRSQQIILTAAILERFHVNRKAKYRALEKLEGAKLISVIRKPGKNPLVTVLVVDDQMNNDEMLNKKEQL
jgi:hypothetical protein